MTWRNRAACLGENPELFFPIGNTYPALLQIEEAKVVCRRCEVVETCLKWASASGQDSGVWGGLSADERHALKRRNARARRASRVTPSLGGGTGAGRLATQVVTLAAPLAITSAGSSAGRLPAPAFGDRSELGVGTGSAAGAGSVVGRLGGARWLARRFEICTRGTVACSKTLPPRYWKSADWRRRMTEG